METVTCLNSSGQNLNQMWQWDENRTIRVKAGALDESLNYEVHFSSKCVKKAFVVEPAVVDACLVVDIPPMLLETPDTITLYVYTVNSVTSEMRVIGFAQIKVVPRQKPILY